MVCLILQDKFYVEALKDVTTDKFSWVGTETDIAVHVKFPHCRYMLWCYQDSYEDQQQIQLMRFADYFGRAFASVGAAQFPWMKMFKESPVVKLMDVRICLTRSLILYYVSYEITWQFSI